MPERTPRPLGAPRSAPPMVASAMYGSTHGSSAVFAAPLDENMRLKLILQQRVTEVRALQELRAHHERRKQHIEELRLRLEAKKQECVEAVARVGQQAEEQAREEETLNADAKRSSERISTISKAAREMEKETERLKDGIVNVAKERSAYLEEMERKMARLKDLLAAATAEANESAREFDQCHRACVQQSTQLKTLTKQGELLTKLGEAWEAGLGAVCDIDATDATLPSDAAEGGVAPAPLGNSYALDLLARVGRSSSLSTRK